MTGDVTVYLRDGDYQISSSLNFGPRDSGNNGFNVLWASFPGEKAVLKPRFPQMNPKPASNVRVFPALLQDRREVLTATSTSGNPNAWSSV